MSKKYLIIKGILIAGLFASASYSMAAYVSGSTGADGAFTPTASQSIQLPPTGIFNYTSVNIPVGVTITYKKNANNTPVTILASGDVEIAGTLDVSATLPLDIGDISGPGLAGPGGYNGGRGGQAGGDAANWINGLTGPNIGRTGAGPGGGGPAPYYSASPWGRGITSGGGGAYGTAAPSSTNNCSVTPGATYGNLSLLPLIGGSGGGGGAGGSVSPGGGGGGGGGAILIGASGTINVTGSILANGSSSPRSSVTGRGAQGGGGSGGAIRLIASTIAGNGAISAAGGSISGGEYVGNNVGTYYLVCSAYSNGSSEGGGGRIRLESETLTRTAGTNPLYVGGSPSVSFIPGMPTLNITSIGGVVVPVSPTGVSDVKLGETAPNPVTVVFSTKGVTVGSTIKLTVLPAIGVSISATSAPTTGTVDSATSSVSINIPGGASSLQASVTYTVLASAGDAMSTYAQGERVEKVRLSSVMGGPSTATLITISGKEFTVPASSLVGIS